MWVVEMPFTEDLILGEQYQKLFLSMIEWDSSEIAQGNFKPWDIRIQNKEELITFEVKADRQSRRTGNVVIEFECNKKPSGITSSTADYWIYFIIGSHQYYMIPREALLDMIKENKYQRIVKGGDGYRSNMYLFRMTDFMDYLELIPRHLVPN